MTDSETLFLLQKEIMLLKKRLEYFESGEYRVRMVVTSTNVSNPPTEAEIASALGTAAHGKMGLINDAGGSSNEYLCVSDGTYWWYILLVKAV